MHKEARTRIISSVRWSCLQSAASATSNGRRSCPLYPRCSPLPRLVRHFATPKEQAPTPSIKFNVVLGSVSGC